MTVQGKYADGTRFERRASTEVKIETRRATILSVTERPIDEDGNGLIDAIEVTARVKVEIEGRYRLTVDLLGKQGRMQEYGNAVLAAGEQTITARFGRSTLLRAGDGPYKIEARLHQAESDLVFASLLENAGVTRAYNQSQFDHGPIYFLGTMSVEPIAIPQAKEKLTVSLDVFTPGGACWWSGALIGPLPGTDVAVHIDFVNGNGVLPKGRSRIELVFDGRTISNDAEGKPLRVGDTSLSCGGMEARLEKAIALPHFPAGTFVKDPPGYQLRSPGPVRLKAGGGSYVGPIAVVTKGGFNEELTIVVEGMPPEIIRERFPARILPKTLGGISFLLRAPPDAKPGVYDVTVHAQSSKIDHAVTFKLIVDP